MPEAITVNGRSLEALHCYVEEHDGILSSPDRSVVRHSVLRRMGGVLGEPVTYDRPVEIRGLIRPPTNSTADLEAAEDALKGLLTGQVRVVWDRIGNPRVLLGTVRKLAITTRGEQHPSLSVASSFTVSIATGDTAWSDVDPMVRHCVTAGAPYDCHVGTAPSRPVIEVFGGATNPEVQIRDAANNLRYRLRFTATLTTAQSIEIDRRTGRIWHYSSGVRTDGMPYLNPADLSDLAALTLDPQDGANVGAVYAQVTSGRMRVMWWRHWL